MKMAWKQLVGNLTVVLDLFRFLWKEKLWWMVPMVTVFIVFGFLIIFAQSSPVAPFLYTLF